MINIIVNFLIINLIIFTEVSNNKYLTLFCATFFALTIVYYLFFLMVNIIDSYSLEDLANKPREVIDNKLLYLKSISDKNVFHPFYFCIPNYLIWLTWISLLAFYFMGFYFGKIGISIVIFDICWRFFHYSNIIGIEEYKKTTDKLDKK